MAFGETKPVILKIDGQTAATWLLTTRDQDTDPNPFSFPDLGVVNPAPQQPC